MVLATVANPGAISNQTGANTAADHGTEDERQLRNFLALRRDLNLNTVRRMKQVLSTSVPPLTHESTESSTGSSPPRGHLVLCML